MHNPHDYQPMDTHIVSQYSGFFVYIVLTALNVFNSIIPLFSFQPNTLKAEIFLGTVRLIFAVMTGVAIWFAHRFLNKKYN